MLDHFLAAQATVYETALAELEAGRKRSHWMWFIFPQIEGLGTSEMSRRYALHSLDEARAYLAHPVLGERLRECTRAMLKHADRSARQILGSPDDMKFHSSMTLFHCAAQNEPLFADALAAFFDGMEDAATLTRI
ncbi:DUF1810 domain-containing protein [Rhizobium sp. PAMB 3174]